MKKYISLCLLIVFLACSSSEVDMFDAARQGNLEMIAKLYHQDVNSINISNKRGHTPLILACYRNQPAAVKLLLKLGADLNYTCDLGTALHASVYQQNQELIQFLLASKIDIDAVDDGKQTALMMAVHTSNEKTVALLLDSEADVERVDEKGKTAFVYAMEQANDEVIQLLKR
jgi:ankyrin repeat protein